MSEPKEIDYHTKANLDLVYNYDKLNYKFEYNAMYQKKILTATVHKKNLSKDYPVEYFLGLLIGAYYLEISKHTSVSKRFTLIYDCKKALLLAIDRANLALKYNPDASVTYDFDRQIERVNNEIERLKVELDIYKYELEVKKLRLETKNYKEYLYVITACILIFGTFFTIDKCKIPASLNKIPTDTTSAKK